MIDLAVLYAILVRVARSKVVVTYAELSQRYHGHTGQLHDPHGTWDQPLGEVNRLLDRHGLPAISSVVVLKKRGSLAVLGVVCKCPGTSVKRVGQDDHLVSDTQRCPRC